MQVEPGSRGRRRRWWVLGVLAVPVLLGVVMGLRAPGGDDGGTADDGGDRGSGGSGSCPDPTFTVDVKTFTDDQIDPIYAPDIHDVSVEGTLAVDSEIAVRVSGINVPMATSPDAMVYATLEDPVVEPGETVSFSGSAPVQLTGSPVVIPDDASARVDWQFAELRDLDDC